jgi:DNA-binding protein
MVVDLSAQLKEPGTYQIEFKHREGQTRFRKISLKSGGREIASEANTAESTKVRLTLPEEIKGRKIELWAESCGTGWFSGRGEIVITRIS